MAYLLDFVNLSSELGAILAGVCISMATAGEFWSDVTHSLCVNDLCLEMHGTYHLSWEPSWQACASAWRLQVSEVCL